VQIFLPSLALHWWQGLFKGALSSQARQITPGMKVAAAKAIASLVEPAELREDYIIPTIFNPAVA
jgi:malate dehydrogenase (oxaloacetate-decarboxylating)